MVRRSQEKNKESDHEREDYNDIFRESNRAAMDDSDYSEENTKQSTEENKQQILRSQLRDQQNINASNAQRDMKLYDEHDSVYNTKIVIFCIVLLLWFTAL